jgi:hypothetical protein
VIIKMPVFLEFSLIKNSRNSVLRIAGKNRKAVNYDKKEKNKKKEGFYLD